MSSRFCLMNFAFNAVLNFSIGFKLPVSLVAKQNSHGLRAKNRLYVPFGTTKVSQFLNSKAKAGLESSVKKLNKKQWYAIVAFAVLVAAAIYFFGFGRVAPLIGAPVAAALVGWFGRIIWMKRRVKKAAAASAAATPSATGSSGAAPSGKSPRKKRKKKLWTKKRKRKLGLAFLALGLVIVVAFLLRVFPVAFAIGIIVIGVVAFLGSRLNWWKRGGGWFGRRMVKIADAIGRGVGTGLRALILLAFLAIVAFSFLVLDAATGSWLVLSSGTLTYYVLFWSARRGMLSTGSPKIPDNPPSDWNDEKAFHEQCKEGLENEAKRERRRKALAEWCNFGFTIGSIAYWILVVWFLPLTRLDVTLLMVFSVLFFMLARAGYVILPSYKFGQMYRGRDKTRTHGDGRALPGRVRPGPCPVIPTQEYIEAFSEQPFTRQLAVVTQIILGKDVVDTVTGAPLRMDGTLEINVDMAFDGSIFDEAELLVRPGLTQSFIETGFLQTIKSIVGKLMSIHDQNTISKNLEIIGLIARLNVSVPYAWRPHKDLPPEEWIAFYTNKNDGEDRRKVALARITNVFLRSELEEERGARVVNLKVVRFVPPVLVEKAQEELRSSELAGQGLKAKWEPLAGAIAHAANAVTLGIVKGLKGEEVSPAPVTSGKGSGGHKPS